jgi:formylglycine-generating enzyme required for sulfatase activity
LPSEKEWEWAARGGVSSQGYAYGGSNDVNAVAWYNSNSSGGTKAVGTKAANELGIYDTSGTVWEWCQDVVDVSNRCIRGGSWYYSASYAPVAYRGSYLNPDSRSRFYDSGFRLARSQGN